MPRRALSFLTFPKLGHAPQVENPARFNSALLKALDVLLPKP